MESETEILEEDLPEGTDSVIELDGRATFTERLVRTREDDEQPLEPSIDTDPREFLHREVYYTAGYRRGPNDVVLSGPVVGGWGPGRYHRSKFVAKTFLTEKYGADRVRQTERNTKGRWSFLIKDLRQNAV